ncbi:hypothetical protein ABBQ32_007288 [Trebouxia sp. C0010 RCD-2024]
MRRQRFADLSIDKSVEHPRPMLAQGRRCPAALQSNQAAVQPAEDNLPDVGCLSRGIQPGCAVLAAGSQPGQISLDLLHLGSHVAASSVRQQHGYPDAVGQGPS